MLYYILALNPKHYTLNHLGLSLSLVFGQKTIVSFNMQSMGNVGLCERVVGVLLSGSSSQAGAIKSPKPKP